MKALKRKLFLSVASLAVCAATLVSTTFAWYTSNSEVSASGLNASSAASTDSLLLISRTGEKGTWGNSVDLSDIDDYTSLMPVAYTAGDGTTQGSFNTFGDGAVAGAADTTDYISFDLYFRGGSELPVIVKSITITNKNAASLPAKDILADAGGLDSTSTATYTVDVLRTLMVETTSVVVTKGSNGDATVKLYDPEKLNTIATDSLNGKTTAGTDYNAHVYYNAVTGNTIETTSENIDDATKLATTGTTKLELGTTPVAAAAGDLTYLKVTFKIFINGWDYACFDAVQGQNISIALNFTCDTADNSVVFTV